jgi:hypothetical protein
LHEDYTFADYDIVECASIDAARKNVLVIGDSIASDTYMMLSQAYPEVQFLQAIAGACRAVIDISDVGGKYCAFEALNAYRFSELIDLDLDLVGPRAMFRASIPGVEILDIGEIQCTPQCDVIEGDRLLYYDSMHFTELGARRTGERLRESFDLLGFISSPTSQADTR